MPAARLAVMGARFDGEEAARLGIAHYLCANAEEIDTTLNQVLTAIDHGAPGAIAATKDILRAVERLSETEIVDFVAERFAACTRSAEGREGYAAFHEKPPPSWTQDDGRNADQNSNV